MTDIAPKVIVIPAKAETPQEQERKRNLRVAAYCRVSTDSEEQLTSYQNQLSYYTAVELSNAGTATVLQYTAPVLILGYESVRMRRCPKGFEIAALILALAMSLALLTGCGSKEETPAEETPAE